MGIDAQQHFIFGTGKISDAPLKHNIIRKRLTERSRIEIFVVADPDKEIFNAPQTHNSQHLPQKPPRGTAYNGYSEKD